MWIENAVHFEDLKKALANKEIFGDELAGKTFFITGATGLVGQNIVNALLYFGMQAAKNIKVVALVRKLDRAQALFNKQLADCGGNLSFIVGDVINPIEVEENIDYILHCASQTDSGAFVKDPVGTIETAIYGTRNILELAKAKCVESVVYLSSMEAYGFPEEKSLLSENSGAFFDCMAVRSCYPESKRMCETMCCAYASQYDVPVKVVRLAQTFGPGVRWDDVRVFADFARKALNGDDIVMHTAGDSARMYLYTMDAVTAILTVLLKGKTGSCYNAANKATYCSIREMAELVSQVLSNGKSRVIIQLDEESRKKYSPQHRLYLDTSKIEALGWRAEYGLSEMYKRMTYKSFQ